MDDLFAGEGEPLGAEHEATALRIDRAADRGVGFTCARVLGHDPRAQADAREASRGHELAR